MLLLEAPQEVLAVSAPGPLPRRLPRHQRARGHVTPGRGQRRGPAPGQRAGARGQGGRAQDGGREGGGGGQQGAACGSASKSCIRIASEGS